MIPDSYLIMLSYIIFKTAQGVVLYFISKPEHLQVEYSKHYESNFLGEFYTLMIFIGIDLLFLSLGHQRHIVGFSFVLVELALIVYKKYQLSKLKQFKKLEETISLHLGYKMELGIVNIKSKSPVVVEFSYQAYKPGITNPGQSSTEVILKTKYSKSSVKEAILSHFDPVDIIGFNDFLDEAPKMKKA